MWAEGGGGLGGASLHYKKVVPILGVLCTEATYSLSHPLPFKFAFGLRHREEKLPRLSVGHG